MALRYEGRVQRHWEAGVSDRVDRPASALLQRPAGDVAAPHSPPPPPPVVHHPVVHPAPPSAGALHSVPPGFIRLVCPVGAEQGLVGWGGTGHEPFRERGGDRRSRWLVDIPAEGARHLLHNGGFALYDPAASR